MPNEIKVPLRVELYAGDVLIAVIDNDPGVWQLVMQHAVAADMRRAPADVGGERAE